MLHVAVVAAALMALPPHTAAPPLPRIRTANPQLEFLIREGREHSPTFAAMAAAVDASNVIVYFEAVPLMETQLRGCVHFMGASGGYRYVRAQIKTAMHKYDVLGSIAHELQHVIEISQHPEVQSEKTLEDLYRRIGDEYQWRAFETDRARVAGKAVRAEVLGEI